MYFRAVRKVVQNSKATQWPTGRDAPRCPVLGPPKETGPEKGELDTNERRHSSKLIDVETYTFSGSGGSMVAKLKLKGIDGMAPPGVGGGGGCIRTP